VAVESAANNAPPAAELLIPADEAAPPVPASISIGGDQQEQTQNPVDKNEGGPCQSVAPSHAPAPSSEAAPATASSQQKQLQEPSTCNAPALPGNKDGSVAGKEVQQHSTAPDAVHPSAPTATAAALPPMPPQLAHPAAAATTDARKAEGGST